MEGTLTSGNDVSHMSDLINRAENARLEFLEDDLNLAFTFVDVCRTEIELGEWDAAHRLLTKVEKAHADVARFLATVDDAERRNEIERKLDELCAARDSIRQKFEDR